MHAIPRVVDPGALNCVRARLSPAATRLPASSDAVSSPADPTTAPIRRVLILKSDRLLTHFIGRQIQTTIAAAATFMACSVADADRILEAEPVDLLVSGVVTTDGDALERLSEWTSPTGRVTRAFVVTTRKEIGVLDVLSRARLEGIFDQQTETLETLGTAIEHIAVGGDYWSPSIAAAVFHARANSSSVLRVLTPTERMVLGVIGDGCDDATAATVLPLKENTIRSVRGALHRKLDIQHKGQLVAIAANYGFVIRTPFGVMRPGLPTLIAAYRPPRPSSFVPTRPSMASPR